MKPKLIIFSAPSGSGKSTIINEVMKEDFNLEFSISASSRAPRKGEKHGREYYFLSPEEFKEKIKNNEFIEWEEVYKDKFYGTLKSEIARIGKKGNNVIFDLDVIGGLNLKEMYDDKALSIFIRVKDINILKERLIKRNTDDDKTINERVEKARAEMKYAKDFDVIIDNIILEDAVEQSKNAIKEFLYEN